MRARAWGKKYRKPHLLISVDHTQIITQLVVLIITKMKNKLLLEDLSTVSPPTLIFGICAWDVVE